MDEFLKKVIYITLTFLFAVLVFLIDGINDFTPAHSISLSYGC